jgi:hypothetical protein
MLGGVEVTAKAREHAQEMLRVAAPAAAAAAPPSAAARASTKRRS